MRPRVGAPVGLRHWTPASSPYGSCGIFQTRSHAHATAERHPRPPRDSYHKPILEGRLGRVAA
eukprot:scaffold276_cov548-Prasinococcus_capsulatus_cf.AAC.24